MPFALIFIGLVLLVAGVRNQQTALYQLVQGDFTNKNGSSFLWWLVAVTAIGSIGYIPKLKGFSDTFLLLIIIAMVIANNKTAGTTGFFTQLMQELNNVPSQPITAAQAAMPTTQGATVPGEGTSYATVTPNISALGQ